MLRYRTPLRKALLAGLASLLACCSAIVNTTPVIAETLGTTSTSERRTTWIKQPDDSDAREITFEVVDGLAIVEGDIVLGGADSFPDYSTFPTSGEYALAITVTNIGSLWPGSVLPYQIHTALIGTSTENKIANAIEHISENSSIFFVLRNAENANQYPDYVEFVNGSGCASYIGRRGGRQSIWLSSSCSTGNAIHEIGHALGLYHEQARSDRDNYVTIYWENILSGKAHNFQQQLSNATDSGNYDYGSIMHYGKYFFSSNGNPTLAATNPVGTAIGQRIGLSTGDIAALGQLYSTDLSIELDASPSVVNPGAMISLSARVTNHQSNNARGVEVEIPIPAGGAYIAADGDSWNCQGNADDIACERNSLSGNDETVLTVYLSSPPQGFPLALSGSVSSVGFDNNQANNAGRIELIVNSQNFAPIISPDQIFRVNHTSAAGIGFGFIDAYDYNGDTLQNYEIVSGQLKDSVAVNPYTGELYVANPNLWRGDPEVTTFTVGVIVSDGQTSSAIRDVSIQLISTEESANNSGGGGGVLSVFWPLVMLIHIIFIVCRNESPRVYRSQISLSQAA